MSNWRNIYKVHPAADVFPMMSDEEIDDLAQHIKANGLAHPPVFYVTAKPNGEIISTELLDGRNRIEALDRLGHVPLTPCKMAIATDIDPVAYVIAANIKRRHLTKQQQADLIVAAHKAAAADKPRQVGEVSKGGRGKIDEVKAAAVAAGDEHGISKRTVERSFAKAEGRKPLSDHRRDQLDPRNYEKSHPVNAALTLVRRMTPAQRDQFDIDYTVWCERLGHKRTKKPNQIGKVIGLIASPSTNAIKTANRLIESMGMEPVVR